MGWDAVGIMEAFDDAKIQIFLCLKKYFCSVGKFSYFCSRKIHKKMDMETMDPKPVGRPRATTKKPRPATEDLPKTPESELMSVEEFFGILRQRVNDYYDSLQS